MLETYGNQVVRIFLRSNYDYYIAARKSLIPDSLQSVSSFITIVQRALEDSLYKDHPMKNVIKEYEISELFSGGKPRFLARYADGSINKFIGVNVSDFFGIPPYDAFKKRIQEFCTSDLEKQCMLIESAFERYFQQYIKCYKKINATSVISAEHILGN